MKTYLATNVAADPKIAELASERFEELDVVALREPFAVSGVASLPRGAQGTVVGVSGPPRRDRVTPVDPRHGVKLTIAQAKLTRYLLDPSSRDGRGKAKFFLAKSFAADGLEQALLAHGASGSVSRVKRTEWGIVIEVKGPLLLPTGGTADVLTAWQIDHGAPGIARLLTAHLD